MVNLVTIDDTRYLVDVGLGANGPCRPLPLISDHELPGIGSQLLKLQYKALAQHSDSKQRMWVYCHRESDSAPWLDAYAFTEVEFFAGDFQVLNLATMTLRQSLFTQSVICIKFLLNRETFEMEGVMILFNDEVKTKVGGVQLSVEKFFTEEERTQALEHHFGIKLTEEERGGIVGLRSELRGWKKP